MKEIINVGLIGYGGGGRFFHAPVIDSVEGLKICKVYATNTESVNHLKELYKDVSVVSSVDDIINDPNIHLAVVATPNEFHYEIAKNALEGGKHVVVEKPFTATTHEADKLISLSSASKKLLTVHHNRRWDSDFKTVEKVVKSNLLGDIVDFEATFDRYNPNFKNAWKEKNVAGSGVLFDLGSHLIDQALCLFGLPVEVFANIQIQKQGGQVDDYFKLMLKYSNLNVILKASSLVRELGPRYVLHGTKGSFIKYGMDVQEAHLKKGLIPKNNTAWGVEPEDIWGKVNTEVNGLHVIGKIESEIGDYREFYKNVYESIVGEKTLYVTPQQGRYVIRIIELAMESNTEKSWVRFQL
ncbi:Gfo/Idh/MocA family oxidoreductase [Clostridium sp.]|uniref:Gfo/Idh/MocA family oxidoreductase n=1 Tax=Clostridium sp. TaxID=1506 RepID=UPI002FC75E7A